MPSEYLFPIRHTRRDFLKLGAAGVAALALPSLAPAEEKPVVKFGSGAWTYTLDADWGRLPEGMEYGLGCGIVIDGKGRIIVTSRSTNPCVAIFDTDGKLLETWSAEFATNVGLDVAKVAATAHGIYWSKEGNDEFLYFTENVAKNAPAADGSTPARIGARVYKTDLHGKVLYTIGNVEQEDATHQKFDWTSPTDVAVAPNGDIYVVDGYGSQRVSRFDKSFKHLKTFGGKGTDNQSFNTCHGIWISTLNGTPEVYIADRANGRYQVYDLELNYTRTIKGDFVKNPCCFYQHEGHLYIPDLGGHVAIIDRQDQPVAKLAAGQSEPAPTDPKLAPKFERPHALTVDAKGNLYVVEWVKTGNVRKFTHTPA